MKNQKFIEFFEMCFGVVVVAFGLSLMIKSGLGQTAVSGLAYNLSKLFGLKVGTFLIFFNVSCVFGQMILLGKKFEPVQILQILVAYLTGQMVNVFCYNFPPIANLAVSNYVLRWLLLLSGVLAASFGVGIMSSVNSLKMPMEQFAMVLSERIGSPFPVVRQSFDFVSIIGCFVLIFLFKLDYSSVREGTWVSMLLLGRSMKYTFPLMGCAMEYINRKLFKFEEPIVGVDQCCEAE